MPITSQQQRIPLVDLQTGLIRREWLAILFGNADSVATDIQALSDALAAAIDQLNDLQTQVDAISSTPDESLMEMIFTPRSTAAENLVRLDSLLCDDTGRLLLDSNGLILTDA